MNKPATAFLATAAVLAGALLAGPPGARAASPAQDAGQTFRHECGACHWAYAPELLPARSWQAITGNLSDHFGEDASLDAETTRRIAAWLVAHAADASGVDSPFLRGLKPDDVPRRITDTPLWQGIHRQLGPSDFAAPGVKTSANCLGCHRG